MQRLLAAIDAVAPDGRSLQRHLWLPALFRQRLARDHRKYDSARGFPGYRSVNSMTAVQARERAKRTVELPDDECRRHVRTTTVPVATTQRARPDPNRQLSILMVEVRSKNRPFRLAPSPRIEQPRTLWCVNVCAVVSLRPLAHSSRLGFRAWRDRWLWHQPGIPRRKLVTDDPAR